MPTKNAQTDRLVVLAKNRLSAEWLNGINDPAVRKIAWEFQGLDGSAWVDAPQRIRRRIDSGGYTGSFGNLKAYISELVLHNYAVRVVRGSFVPLADDTHGFNIENISLGFDVVFSENNDEYYSIVLHSLAGSDIIANYIRSSINEKCLLNSIEAARAVAAMLHKSTHTPKWLEASYLKDAGIRLLVFRVDSVLVDTAVS